MADYGHDLLFGSFITPSAAQPDTVVALAQIADEAGLDLISAQDHPYQPAFLDTWTLLSVLATATTRAHVMPNVANLAMRPPAVLARSVASLDRLTGGRVELGLGAGAFNEAVVANGGPHRSAADAVEALAEAIEIIRAIWSGTGTVRVAGKHYRVVGAKPGPTPAHDVGIWLGAYKPRMLRLTGRLADGWLPSLGYATPDDLPRMNAIIDEAAVSAGRPVTAVRRMLNISGEFGRGSGFPQGPPGEWARQLAELTLTTGISAYILAGDDPDAIARFGAEVAPAVRELVEAERLTPSAEAPAVVPAAGPSGADGLDLTPTPDDGVRRSSVRLWDESTRPTGPAPRPDAVYTPRGRAGGADLIAVHDHLRRELAQVYDLVDRVEAGQIDVAAARSHINTMTLRQNNWTLGTYCESYCRLVTTHHSIEDAAVFPHLARHEPGLVPVLNRLEEEHLVIHGVLEHVDRALVALVDGGDLADLRAAIDLLSDTLRSHLSYEERELVEPLSRFGGSG